MADAVARLAPRRVQHHDVGEIGPIEASITCKKALRARPRMGADEEIRDAPGALPAAVSVRPPRRSCVQSASLVDGAQPDPSWSSVFRPSSDDGNEAATSAQTPSQATRLPSARQRGPDTQLRKTSVSSRWSGSPSGEA